MFKNVTGQKLIVFAFDASTGLPKTGDAANIIAYVSKDYGAVTVLTDTGTGGASEMDATNAKGYYIFDLTQGETNADFLLFSGKSSTSNIVVVGAPSAVFTLPPNFTKAVIDTAGLIDANTVKIGPTGAGTPQTARDIGASVLLSTGTGAGQLDFTSGVVKVNVTQLLGTAWLTPGVAGTPDVNAKLHGGTSQTGRDIGASVLLSSGTGTGQLSLSTGLVTLAGVTHTGAVIPTVTTVTNQLTAAAIATGVWTDTTAGDFTTALSIGKSVMNGVTLGTGLTVVSVSGAVGSVTGLTASNLDTTISSRMATYTQPTGFLAATFPTTVASTTNITAGTLTTVTTATNVTTVNGLAANVITATSIAANAITAAKIATDAIGAAQLASDAVTEIQTGLATPTNITAGTITTVTTVTNQLTASQIATGIWQDATAGDFTTANSIGKSLYNSFTAGTSVFTVAALANTPVTAAGPSAATIATAVWTDTTASDFTTALSVGKSVMNGVTLGTGLTVARVTLTDTLTTYTGNTVQTGDSFARIGATGSGLTSLAASSTALSTAQWTNTLATNLGTTNTTVSTNLDTTVSSRGTSTLTQTQVTGGAYSVQSASCVLGDARIANLDGTITSRMATYTQPTGFLAANFTTGIPISGDLSATMKTSVTTAATAATPVVTISGAISTLSALNTSLSSTHGAGSWATATGFSTLVATDIVSNGAITTSGGDVVNTQNTGKVGGQQLIQTTGKLWTLDGNGNPLAPASATTAINTLLGTSGNAATIGAAIDVAIGEANAAHNIVADATSGNAALAVDIDALPTNAELATALGTSDDSTLAAVEVLRKLLRADHYIDAGTIPWALVYMEEGTGGIGVGVEIFRKQLKSVTGTNLVSTDTVVGQAKT